MIQFVICDDEAHFREKIKEVIHKIFMKNNIEYEIKEFSKYNASFEKLIEEKVSSRIYILDIELAGSISGIDIARNIRKNDWDSSIILVTSHSELGYEALKAQIMLLDFISKFDSTSKNLEQAIKKSLRKINVKKTVTFKAFSVTYRLYLDDIVYIVKDPMDKRCTVKTTYNEIVVAKNLIELYDLLGDDRFVFSHRSCIVNLDKVKDIDWKNSLITFNTGDTIDLLSRDKKKELRDYVNA